MQKKFSSIVKTQTIQVVLTLAISMNWSLKKLNVNITFLNEDFQEIIHITQPRGFEDKLHPTQVSILKKALYGFKQALRLGIKN